MTPSKDWKESIAAGEDQLLERLAEKLREAQRKNKTDKIHRGLHAKSNVNLRASFTVEGNLPDYARVGIFAEPGNYKAFVRFSNGSGRKQHDARGDVRGVAFKLLGVPGKKLIPGLEDAKTQDFLLIQTPTVPFQNPEEFVGLVYALSFPLSLPGLVWRVGFGRFLSLGKTISEGMSRKVNSLAASTYHSALPLKWGEHAVKVSLKPTASERATPDRKDPDFLAKELKSHLQQGPISYEFWAHFFVDETKTPIENPTIEWRDCPTVKLGTLTLETPVASEEGALHEYVEKLSFDPWHAPVEFRPLGMMMRARNHAYRLSTIERGASKEPEDAEIR
jgi:catalase